jgi:hypothetical protein
MPPKKSKKTEKSPSLLQLLLAKFREVIVKYEKENELSKPAKSVIYSKAKDEYLDKYKAEYHPIVFTKLIAKHVDLCTKGLYDKDIDKAETVSAMRKEKRDAKKEEAALSTATKKKKKGASAASVAGTMSPPMSPRMLGAAGVGAYGDIIDLNASLYAGMKSPSPHYSSASSPRARSPSAARSPRSSSSKTAAASSKEKKKREPTVWNIAMGEFSSVISQKWKSLTPQEREDIKYAEFAGPELKRFGDYFKQGKALWTLIRDKDATAIRNYQTKDDVKDAVDNYNRFYTIWYNRKMNIL